MRGLSSDELRAVLGYGTQTSRHFAAVCAYDELPSGLLQKPSLFIVNNEQHALPGKHWMVLYFPKQGNPEIFDSLGYGVKMYDSRIENLLVLNGPQYLESKVRLQSFSSHACGYFCLYYAVNTYKGSSFHSILSRLVVLNLKEREGMVINMFRHVIAQLKITAGTF